MNLFKRGDRVGLPYYDRYAYGEITIIRDNDCKVLFDGDFDLAYDYYPAKKLRLESIIKAEK